MKKITTIALIIFSSIIITAQDKLMTPETYDIWNSMEQVRISTNGEWVSYTIVPGKGDKTLVLYNTKSGQETKYERSHSPQFDYDNKFVAFKTSIAEDSLQSLKLKKTKKDKLPKDTITLVSLNSTVVDKVTEVEKFSMPRKSGSIVALSLKGKTVKKDSTLVKDENSKNGRPLLVYDFKADTFYTFNYIKDFKWAEKTNRLVLHLSLIHI